MGNPINVITNDISGVLNDIENGVVNATNAVADGTLSAIDAMDNGLKYTSANLDDNFQTMIDEGFATSLDAFSYIADLAAYNGTGNYYGTSKDDVIIAVDILGFIPGFSLLREIWGSGEGKIYAKDGDDTIIMASFAATVYTGSGNDAIYGGSAALRVEDTTGNLIVGQASVSTIVNKSGDGNITFGGISGYLKVDHSGANGDITAYSIAAANDISLSGTSGDITFYGVGIGNIINHSVSDYGKVEFYGGGGANVITASGNHTDIDFYGAGAANVIVNTASKGDMNIYALGQRNLVVKVGDGNFNTYLASYSNVAVHIGNGDSKISMLGGLNTYTKVGDGDSILAMAGGLNVATMVGDGDVYGGLAGIGNVVTKKGNGDLYMGLAAAGNVVSHIDNSGNNSDTIITALGGANVVTKKGNGEFSLGMAGLGNVATHIGDGNVNAAQTGGASIITKIGDGDVNAVQIGGGNILTQIGDGHSLALMSGNANVFTKVGDGLTATTMLSNALIGGNLFTHIGNGDSYAFMSGTGNTFTKVGGISVDKTVAAMFGMANLFTHIGDGMSVALMHSLGNIFTKVGDGPVMAAMFGGAGNIVTHIGNGDDYALMNGNANIFTKVGDGQNVALMSGVGNIATHIGAGDQVTLASGSANIISKLGDGNQITVAVGDANMISHVDITGQSDSNSYSFAKGQGNLITKVGDGMQVTAVSGTFNMISHVGDGDDYLMAHGGEANVMMKVGDGNLVAGLMMSKLNLITQIGEGDGYYGMWGEYNVATKVGNGRVVAVMDGDNNLLTNVGNGQQLALMNGEKNINVKIGDGDSVNIVNGKYNLVTKVGDGLHLAAMKGEYNVNVQIGDGMTISAMHAKNNLTVKVGNGDFYGLSIAKSEGSFKDMLDALFSEIKETAKGHIAGEIIGQLVWGPEGEEASASEAPALTNDDQTNPNIDTNVNSTTTETSESSLNTQVDSVNNAAIDTSASAEDINNAGLASNAEFGAQYSTLTQGVDIVTDGSVFQRKLELEDSDILQGNVTNIITGDFNGDGLDDIIRQEKGTYDDDDTQTADIYLANADGTFDQQALTDYTIMKGDHSNIIVGDYNGDGLDDFIRQEKGAYDNDDNGTAQVYLSDGDGTFSKQDLTDYATMKGDYTKLIVGDFNGDGNDDFIRQETGALPNGVANEAKVYLSDGDGTFTGQLLTDYNDMRWDVNIIVGDYNGDGQDDLIAQRNNAMSWIMFANGDGTFERIASGFSYRDELSSGNVDMIVGDYNGDGKDDFIAQRSSEHSWLMLSEGDGSFDRITSDFEDRELFKRGDADLIVGDYNGDGIDDFLRQDKGINSDGNVDVAKLYLASSDGSFTKQDMIDDTHMSGDKTTLIIGDYDGDGTDDIIRQEKATLADGLKTASLYSNKKVYDNIETPTDPNFDGSITQVKIAIADSALLKGDETNILVGDYNGDGKDDFIRQEKGVADDDALNTANLYMSNGDGTFSQQLLGDYDSMKGDGANLIIGDYNGDGKDDFIRQEKNGWDDDDSRTGEMYLSNGDGTFGVQVLTDSNDMKGDGTNIIVGDYNGDGLDDFIRQEKGAWDDDNDRTADMYLSDGDGTFTRQALTHYTEMKGDDVKIIVGDYNGDGKDDFIAQRANAFSTIMLANGDGTFTKVDTGFSYRDELSSSNVNMIVGDYNGDGKDDFIAQRATQHSWIMFSNGDGSFNRVTSGFSYRDELSSGEADLIVGDYNGDGKDDFIAQKSTEHSWLMLSEGDGSFDRMTSDFVDRAVLKKGQTNLILGDYDGDGKDDFIRQEKGDADNDQYNTANLYLNRNDYADEVEVAPVSTTSEDLLINDDIANSGDSSLSDAGGSAVSGSISQSNADIGSLTQEGSDTSDQAVGVKDDMASDNTALSDYFTGLSDDYLAEETNDTTIAGDAARNEYTVGMVDVDSYVQDAQTSSTTALTDAQTNTDNAEGELSEADLNADQANNDATASQADATTAQNDANAQESQAQNSATNAENQANNAQTTANTQSGSNDINNTDNTGRTESSGSGLTVDNSAQSGVTFSYVTDQQAISDNENTLLNEEDEEALQDAITLINNMGGSSSNTTTPYNPVDTSGEGTDNNGSDVVDAPDAGFLANGGEFKNTSFGTKRKVDSDLQDNTKRVKGVNDDNVTGYEGARKEVNQGIIDIKDAVEGDGLFISQAYDEVYSYTVNAFGEEGGVSFSDANITLIAKLRTQYEASSGTAGSRAKIGEEVFDSFFNESNLLLRITKPKELFALVKDEGNSDAPASTFENRVEAYLNTKLESALENQFFDGEGDNAVVKSDNKFNYSAVNSQLNNIGYELVDADNKAYSSSAGTDIKNKWLKTLPSNDPAAELVKSLVFDPHGRSERDAYAKNTVYKEVYGDNIVNPHGGDNGINGIWDSVTQARGIADTHLSTDSGKPSSINHILAESSIAVLLSDTALKISKMNPDSDERNTALETMKAFFNKVAGVSDGGFGGKSQSFSDIANTHFVAAVANSDINLTELSHSMAAISYAPGNVRWGDGSLNSARGNFLDPIFEKDSEGTVELSASSISVKNAVESLNGIVDVSVTNAALSMDMHIAGTDARMYSTNKIIGGTGVDITPDVNGDIHLGEHLLKIFDYSKETGMKSVTKIGDSGSVENSIEYKFKPDGNIGSVESVDGEDVFVAKTFNHTQEEANNLADRQKSHDLIKNEDGTFAQNEDGTFKTKLTDKDSNYKAIDQGNDLVVYEYTDSDGEISYRVVNTAKEYSIYMKTPPVIDASGNLDLSGRAAHTFGHGEKTGETYTKDSGSPTSSFYGEDNKILQSSPLGLIDHANQAEIDKTSAGAVVDNYKLTKPREEFLANEDQYQKKHLDQTMHATIGNMGANDIVIVPGKYSDLTRQGLESDLTSYGVTDNRMHVCRGDDPTQVHALTISDSVKNMASGIKAKIMDNVKGLTKSTNISDSDIDSVKNNAPNVDSDDSNGRQTSYEGVDTGSGSSGSGNANNKEATRGNIQVQVGDGEFVSGMWGENNLGLKIGTGGFKGAVFGENNILVHIGNAGDVEYSTNVGGYEAFEGAQLMIGNKNVSFNYGDSNDFIVAIDKSIPLPPFVSPFDGPSNIAGYLQDTLVTLGQEEDGSKGLDYYHKQNDLWSYGNAELIVNNVSGLDQNSDVYYQTIFDYGSESDRDTRALQTDLETRLNNDFNNWSSPADKTSKEEAAAGENGEGESISDTIKNTQANIVVAGQGADIIMANGANQFLFGDNIQSIMDITLSSLFGMLTQADTSGDDLLTHDFEGSFANFKEKAFDLDISILPDELKAQFANMVAVSLPEITLGDIFTVDYNANGSIYSSNGASLNGDEMSNLLASIAQFGNNQISRYSDPEYIMDSLKASLNLAEGAAEQIKTTFGIQDPEGYDSSQAAAALPGQEEGDASSGETLGFGGLTMPSIFDIGGIASGFGNIPKLIEDLAGTINSFGGDANNIQDAIIEFFTTSGYMQDDGDLIVSMGEKNYSWGGHGNDIGAFLGMNNNFWGGRGEDMFYGLGDNNQFSGNHDNDTGILIGINNLFLGGQGDDFALSSGRLNNLSGGSGDDSLFVFGADSWLSGDEGDDYLVASGNFNTVMAGEGNDYVVSIGNYNTVDGGEGIDVISVFGNKNTIYSKDDNDMIRILGYESGVNAGSGDDLITLDVKSKDNIVEGSSGNDNFVLGGYDNKIYGESGSDKFLINHDVINNTIKDISDEDFILFEDLDYTELWFERQGDDLEIYIDRGFTDEELFNNPGLINEAIGVTSFEDYFLGNMRNIALSYEDENHYSILNSSAITQFIAVMSDYEIDAYGDGFFDYVSYEDENLILDAWENTTNYLIGSDGGDVLYGYEKGQDIITGGQGEDIFVFDSLVDSTVTSSDIITDFTKGEDIISLSSMVFTGLINDQSLEDDTLLSYIYDAVNDQTVVTDKSATFQFKLSGNIALDINDFDFMNNEIGRNVIVGDAADNVIYAVSDSDEFYGQDGNDQIYSGSGANIIDGGAGLDYVRYDQSNAAITINLETNVNQGGHAQGDILLNIERVFASGYDDHITGSVNDDYLYAKNGNDTIYGNDGDDRIFGEFGDNFLYGDAGNDQIYSGTGADTIDGGAGLDYVRYDQSNVAVTLNLETNINQGGHAQGDILSNIEKVMGSHYDDHITGSLLGNDTIYGNDGHDIIFGNDGDNLLYGESGYDHLYSGSGADTIDGGSGIDTARYDMSDAAVTVNLETNVNQGGYAQGDTLVNIERVYGSSYDDHITGSVNDDLLQGLGGNDIIYGNAGDNFLYGETGHDHLYSGSGADSIDGGSGIDSVRYDISNAAVTINLDTNINQGGYAQGDLLYNIERVFGSDHDDHITGSLAGNDLYAKAGNDTIYGNDGNDRIFGNSGDNFLYGDAGNDQIYSGTGADTIDGGEGFDDVRYYQSNAAVTVNLETNINQGGDAQGDIIHNIERVYGSNHDDHITGSLDIDHLYAKEGNDTIHGNGGDDRIYGDSGDNFLYGDAGNDLIFSGSGADTIDGGSGTDEARYDLSNAAVTVNLATNINLGGYAQGDLLSNIERVIGSIYDDHITGGLLDDDLRGGAGADTIIGGSGSDNLIGGSGNDIFSFESLSDSTINASDLITDFTQGEDTINLSSLSFTGITNDQSQTDSDILTYEYDSVNDQTIVSNEEDTFEFKLSGNIALDVNDFDFIG